MSLIVKLVSSGTDHRLARISTLLLRKMVLERSLEYQVLIKGLTRHRGCAGSKANVRGKRASDTRRGEMKVASTI